MPIVVGGTGLYIKGALYDYTFEETESKHDEIKAKYAHYTNEELHQYLASFDPQSALDLHPNNRQRVLRAIGIYEESGKRKTAHLSVMLRFLSEKLSQAQEACL